MIIKREIGEKGQVVIPKDIRDLLGLRKGIKVIFEIKDEKVFLRPEGNPEEFIKDFLNVPNKRKNGSVKEIKRLILEENEIY
mgnify:CR=1 FL=1